MGKQFNRRDRNKSDLIWIERQEPQQENRNRKNREMKQTVNFLKTVFHSSLLPSALWSMCAGEEK